MRKEKYINLIKETGFQKVDVQGEEFFSIGLGDEDAMAKAIAEEAEIPMEQLHELARSVLSIKVSAIKPIN